MTAIVASIVTNLWLASGYHVMCMHDVHQTKIGATLRDALIVNFLVPPQSSNIINLNFVRVKSSISGTSSIEREFFLEFECYLQSQFFAASSTGIGME